jgi:hypothetical protein
VLFCRAAEGTDPPQEAMSRTGSFVRKLATISALGCALRPSSFAPPAFAGFAFVDIRLIFLNVKLTQRAAVCQGKRQSFGRASQTVCCSLTKCSGPVRRSRIALGSSSIVAVGVFSPDAVYFLRQLYNRFAAMPGSSASTLLPCCLIF